MINLINTYELSRELENGVDLQSKLFHMESLVKSAVSLQEKVAANRDGKSEFQQKISLRMLEDQKKMILTVSDENKELLQILEKFSEETLKKNNFSGFKENYQELYQRAQKELGI